MNTTTRSLPTRRWAGTAATLLLLVLTACGDSTGPTGQAREFIIFVSTRTGVSTDSGNALSDIYRMSPDGSDVQDLTSDPAYYTWLKLSPDARRIAFVSNRYNYDNLWTVKLNGTGLLRLTGEPGERPSTSPYWSPDGSMIAFNREKPTVGWEAYVMNADGTGVLNLSDSAGWMEPGVDATVAGWSPDGKVVLWGYTSTGHRIFLVNPDGSGLEMLFDGDLRNPEWSPDGTKVLYMSNEDIFVRNVDGTGLVNLTNDTTYSAYLYHQDGSNWSPDGSRIAFNNQGGEPDVYVVNADATGLVNVTNDPFADQFLAWSPDGTRILFQSDRTGDQELYVVNADGTGLVNLTNRPDADDYGAIWVAGS